MSNNLLDNVYSVVNSCLKCENLEQINLKKNPLSKDYYYKYQIILRLKGIKKLDNELI